MWRNNNTRERERETDRQTEFVCVIVFVCVMCNCVCVCVAHRYEKRWVIWPVRWENNGSFLPATRHWRRARG